MGQKYCSSIATCEFVGKTKISSHSMHFYSKIWRDLFLMVLVTAAINVWHNVAVVEKLVKTTYYTIKLISA